MRVTTEDNVKEVLVEIDKEISVLDALLEEARDDSLMVVRYASRKWGLKTAKLIIVAHLIFE